MKSTDRKPFVNLLYKIILPLIILFFVVSMAVVIPACTSNPEDTFKIGVLLPLTGPDSMESEELLNWLAAGLNNAGGIGGAPLELVYKDTYKTDILSLANEFINDPSIQIVIGPQRSSELHAVAPLFIESKKLLISPMATSGDLLRAYGKKDFIWRTCQSDIAQVRSILYELQSRNVNRMALIYSDDSYGQTFLNWTGFFCTELGIELLNQVSYNNSSNLAEVLDEALSGDPQYILAAAFSEESVELVKLLQTKKDVETRLFLTDAAESPYLLETLGEAAEGIELMSPAADPGSGFEEAYFAEFGYYPWDYAASTCDAFLLAVYTLARQEAPKSIGSFFRREPLEESFKQIITSVGDIINWNEYNKAVELILKGELPEITGASGPLRFDSEFGVDPVESFYSLNRIEYREGVFDFFTIRRFNSTESKGVGLLSENASAAHTFASHQQMELSKTEPIYLPLSERENVQAVIISTTKNWENYRHQADTLAIYNFLKNNGLRDDDIIVFSYDDIPWLPENSPQGNIRHEVDGANLRNNAVIDYSGESITVENLRNVLLGRQTDATPLTLESDESTNLLIFITGHGMPRAIDFFGKEQLKSSDLARLMDEMYSLNRFRKALIILEACYGESLGMELNTPGVVFLTSSSRIESSFGTHYDHKLRQWLANEFTVQVINAMTEPGTTIEELYLTVYKHVIGSHVRLVNYENFGDLQTPVSEFITP